MEAPPPGVHGSPINPLVGLYATSDGRYISFVMMQPTKFWADVCRHIDQPELADDPRFATVEKIAANTAEAVEILTKAIATRTLAGVERTLRDARRTVGAGAGHPAGGRRRAGPRQRVPGAAQANSNWSPTRSSSMSPRRTPGRRRGSPSRPTRS